MTANKVSTALVVLAVFTVLLAAGISLAGGIAMPAAAQSAVQQATTQQYTMADIDNALASGPVFIEFETKECSYCKQQKPISEGLAADYKGKVTFLFVDATQDRELARAFQISGVPQMDVILNKTSGGYTYVGKDGQTSGSVGASRFVGLTQKDALVTALDAAVRMRGH